MQQFRSSRLPLLLLCLALLLSLGCSPKRRSTPAPEPGGNPSGSSSGSSSGRVRPRAPVHDWRGLESRVRNLDARTSKAIDLISQAWELKHKYDAATGAERKSLGSRIDTLYTQAGDIYDEIVSDVDDIEASEKIETGLLMRRGPRLASFVRSWERKSKILRRMSFR